MIVPIDTHLSQKEVCLLFDNLCGLHFSIITSSNNWTISLLLEQASIEEMKQREGDNWPAFSPSTDNRYLHAVISPDFVKGSYTR